MTTETDPGHPRTTALLLIAQFAAMLGAFLILAPAIDWPASLDLPPSEILPLLVAQQGAVFAGYLSYLVHALLLVPLAILLPRALGVSPSLGMGILGLGLLAAFGKALGILRWLVLMPGLAVAWTDPAPAAETKAAIGVVYAAFNAYAGGVGEALGVGLFTGVWTLLLSLALFRRGARVLGAVGTVAGLGLLATLLSVIGVENPVLPTGAGMLWQFWTLGVAWHLWRARREAWA